MKYPHLTKVTLTLSLLFCALSCSTDQLSESSEKSFISVKVSASPSDFENLYVELSEIHLKVIDDETHPKCWLRISASNSGIYDLNQLVSGNDVLLIDNSSAPTGSIYEVKLVLGETNYIIENNERIDLFTNVVLQEGLTIRLDTNFNQNETYNFILNFDGSNSVFETHIEDHYILKPSLSYRMVKE